MLEVDKPQDLKEYVGKELGVSDWVTVDQQMIDKFADATGDHQWIHVDVERAKKELPTGNTIAHGYLTLSLVPRMAPQIMKIRNRSRGINYGSNKIRFTGMVPAGSRVRMRQKLLACEDIDGDGVRLISQVTIEREGEDRPVMIGELIGLAYN
jgi:acyl dehydratase